MSVGAICFASSGSDGGCWVVLVFSRPFFLERRVFFPIRDLHPQKKIYVTYTKKIFPAKKAQLKPKKKYVTYAKKKSASYAYFHNRATLSLCVSLVSEPPPPLVGGAGGPMGKGWCTRCVEQFSASTTEISKLKTDFFPLVTPHPPQKSRNTKNTCEACFTPSLDVVFSPFGH